MAMAIAIPFTFGLDPLPAIAFLVGANKGGLVGGAVPAILMNTPGTPDAAATALDGHPLAKQGKPLKATKMALFSSITGDTFSDIVLITVSAPLAVLALRMGPIEIVALMIFAFSVLAGLMGNSLTKGIIAAALGLLVASIGQDPDISRRVLSSVTGTCLTACHCLQWPSACLQSQRSCTACLKHAAMSSQR